MSVQQGPPVISVIIPVLNGAATIPEQLDALAAQDFDQPWELIVCDNGSTDDTRAVVFAAREAFPAPIRVVDAGERRGVAFARNVGILATRADRIAICDADDRVGPLWLQGAYAGLDDHDVVGGPLRRYVEPFDPDSERLPYLSVGDDGIMGGNIAMRRNIVLALGGFDASFTGYGREDHEFSVRLWQTNASIGADERLELYYHVSDSTWDFVRKIYSSCVADVAIWRRHPDVFPGRQGRLFVLRETVGLPVNLVKAAIGGGPRRMARVVVNLIAHARTMLPPQQPLAAPILLSDMSQPREVNAESVQRGA